MNPKRTMSIKPLSSVINDRFLFMVILILGALGCYYSFGFIKNSQLYHSHEIILSTEDYSESDLRKFAHTRPLHVDGDMRVGEYLSISIDKMLETEPLYVDFGNGDIERLVNKENILVSYSMPGAYGVELFTVQDNQKVVLSSQQINIAGDLNQLTAQK